MAKELKKASYTCQWGTYDKHTLIISYYTKKGIIEMFEKAQGLGRVILN